MPSLPATQVLSVSDEVEVRDRNDESWQVGVVVRFEEDGEPRVRVEVRLLGCMVGSTDSGFSAGFPLFES